jgi:hypothetical protein
MNTLEAPVLGFSTAMSASVSAGAERVATKAITRKKFLGVLRSERARQNINAPTKELVSSVANAIAIKLIRAPSVIAV